jgi:uncharacterized protein
MSSEKIQPRQIKCPQCGLPTFYSTENPFRPFCSERCRLIDLGEWASESYKVPVTSKDRNHDNEVTPEDLESSDEDE